MITAVVTGLAAAWLFDISTLEGLLLGSILASTDGAAVFAMLRGSTLRRRLARTLEGEAGLNDPVAVLLVIGFIDWIEKPRLRRRRHARSCSCSRSGSASRSARCSAASPGLPAASRGSPPPASTRSRRSRWPRWPSVAPTSCTARASSPSTWPGWRSAARRLRPSARSPRSTRGWPGWRRSAMFLVLGLLVFPSRSARSRQGHVARAHRRGRRARPCAVLVSTAFAGSRCARADGARLGRAARRRAGRARDASR